MTKLVPALLLFFTLSFLIRSDGSFDQDLGRHIRLGEIMFKTGTVPKVNLFSYTNPDFPFINTHWLFEAIAYFFDQTIGINWLLYLKITIVLGAVALTIFQIYKPGLSTQNTLLLFVGFIFLHVLRERLDLRPEIFSFLFTALTLFILQKFAEREKVKKGFNAIFILPIIQLLWINTHVYFFVGLVLQAIYLIYLGYQKLRFHTGCGALKIVTIVFILSVAVSLINPNGLEGFLYPLNVQKNYGYTIVENQTMFLLENIGFRDRNFLFVKVSIAIIILSVIAGFIRKTLTLVNLLLLSFGAGLAILNVRSFPYLIFICLKPALENFGAVKFGRFCKFLTVIVAILILSESYLYLNGNYYKYTDSQNRANPTLEENGKDALDFVLKNNLPAPVYNNFDIGSYIIYRGFPKYKVFVDGRPEAYPKEFFSNIYIPSQSDYDNFKKLDGQFNFKTIIFSHTDQTPWGKTFLSSISKDNNWSLVFLDDSMVIYLKNEDVQARGLKTIDLSSISPNTFKYENHFSYLKIASLLLNNQYTKTAIPFLQKSLQIFPQSPIANSIMARLLIAKGDFSNYAAVQNHLEKSKNIFFW